MTARKALVIMASTVGIPGSDPEAKPPVVLVLVFGHTSEEPGVMEMSLSWVRIERRGFERANWLGVHVYRVLILSCMIRLRLNLSGWVEKREDKVVRAMPRASMIEIEMRMMAW